MGRPALGRSARTVTGSVKLTALEAEALVAKYGTVHAGLRAAIDAQLGVGKPRRPKAEQVVAPEPVLEVVDAPSVVAPCRVHKRYKVVNRWVDKGQEWTLKRCQDCGYELTVLDHA